MDGAGGGGADGGVPMRIVLHGVRVDGRREPMLESFDLAWAAGECVLVAGEPGHGHTALALVATGRLAPSAGTVTLDPPPQDHGRRSGRAVRPATLRDLTAVVDVPGVTEPDEALTVADTVAEGLALAGRRSLPGDVARWLEEHSLLVDRRRRLDQLPGVVRTAVLAALAVEAREVRFVVLTLPDRHGGDASGWWEVAQSLARDGYGVLVQCTRASARDLGVDLPAARGSSVHQPPVVVLRATPVPVVDPDPDPEPAVDPLPGPGPADGGAPATDPGAVVTPLPASDPAAGEAPEGDRSDADRSDADVTASTDADPGTRGTAGRPEPTRPAGPTDLAPAPDRASADERSDR